MTHTERIAAAFGLGLLLMIGFAYDRWVLMVSWWPMVGSKWRAVERRRKYLMPAWTGPDSPQSPVPVPDDEPIRDTKDPRFDPEPFRREWDDEPSTDDDADQMIAAWRGDDEEHEQLAALHPIYLDLSDDPDLIVWDAKQQADRCWEIVHIEFPRLRAELAHMWEAAA